MISTRELVNLDLFAQRSVSFLRYTLEVYLPVVSHRMRRLPYYLQLTVIMGTELVSIQGFFCIGYQLCNSLTRRYLITRI